VVLNLRSRETLAFTPTRFGDQELMPKERALVDLCLQEKAKGREVLAYSGYSDTPDTTSRLKQVLEQAGLKAKVFRASVDTARREDWILTRLIARSTC
jgi:hypothetical protein